jgi:hypothetical protein
MYRHRYVTIASYVYWTVHHLDSWIKVHQLDVTCFIISLFNAQHVSDVGTSIFRSLPLICWVISWAVLLWFDVCWCYGVVRQYNPWNNSTNKSQAPEDGCTNIRNMLSIKLWNNKASDIKLVYLYSITVALQSLYKSKRSCLSVFLPFIHVLFAKTEFIQTLVCLTTDP